MTQVLVVSHRQYNGVCLILVFDYISYISVIMQFNSFYVIDNYNSFLDGWETVKVRSRWRLNPLSQSSGNIKLRGLAAASRYSLPSPATSLPALSLHSDLSDDTHDKLHKDKQNQEIAKGLKNINKALPKKTNNNRDCLDNTIPKRGKLREERNVQKAKTLVNDRRQVAREKEGMTAKKTCDKLQINKDDLLLKSSVNR